MEKSCINCKWLRNGMCFNKEVNKNIGVNDKNNFISYIEQGYLRENVYDNINVDDLARLVIEELYNQDFIKKNKKIDNFVSDDIEGEIMELIGNTLSKNMIDYFDDNNNSRITINEIREFHCNHWE